MRKKGRGGAQGGSIAVDCSSKCVKETLLIACYPATVGRQELKLVAPLAPHCTHKTCHANDQFSCFRKVERCFGGVMGRFVAGSVAMKLASENEAQQ